MAEQIEATVQVKRELVYELPDQFGMAPEFVDLDLMVDDDGELDLAKVVAAMPEGAWGWSTQERLETFVDYQGEERQLTSLPINASGTTFLDGREITQEEVLRMIHDQEQYRQSQKLLGRGIGALPHGQDKRPLAVAINNGDRIVLTRTLNYRELRPGDRIVDSPDQ